MDSDLFERVIRDTKVTIYAYLGLASRKVLTFRKYPCVHKSRRLIRPMNMNDMCSIFFWRG